MPSRFSVERQGRKIVVHGPMHTEYAFEHDGRGDVYLPSKPLNVHLGPTEMNEIYQLARQELIAANPKHAAE